MDSKSGAGGCFGGRHHDVVLKNGVLKMRPFHAWRDPLFWLCCVAYALNSWIVKPHLHSEFWCGHFNDLLLVPCALPPLFFLHDRLKLRIASLPPSFMELVFHLALWSLWFEWIGPHYFRCGTGDLWDVAAYAGGGFAAWLIWRQMYRMPREYSHLAS